MNKDILVSQFEDTVEFLAERIRTMLSEKGGEPTQNEAETIALFYVVQDLANTFNRLDADTLDRQLGEVRSHRKEVEQEEIKNEIAKEKVN